VTVGVSKWLGIPYARSDRFGPPELVPFDAAGTYDAFGPAAPQPLDSPLGEIVPGMRVVETDEAVCLTLNVWAPDSGDSGRPVLVWFHGGSFVIGAASQPVYDGALLASEQNVIVVTVNYRVGVLGFLDARSAGGVANCGVRDALCALEWVRKNIANFGGDPARVVAFGESAGGGLLLHALASGRARGLIAGAIVQSGATSATFDDERAKLVAGEVCTQAGVAAVDELVALPVDAIIDAQGRAMGPLLPIVGFMPYHPMVDDDLLTERPADALAGGAAEGIALILGTTADEMRLFMPPVTEPPARERVVKRLMRYAGIDEASASRVIDDYARAMPADDMAAVWAAVFSDSEMQVPARAMCDAHAPHGPVFTYLFAWEGPNVGACHGIDIPFAFGNFDEGWDAFVGLDDDGRDLSRQIRETWASFARENDPGWPPYPSAMILDRRSRLAPAHPLFVRATALISAE
jgi:para-nitrobenzyl esterase